MVPVSDGQSDSQGVDSQAGKVCWDRHTWLTLVAASVLIILDQLTKWWALEVLGSDRIIGIVGTLRLRLVFNTGAAFGHFEGMGPFFGIAAVVVVIWFTCSHRMIEGVVPSLAVGSIVGGAVGNLVDRVFRSDAGVLGGAVIDFIDVQWWPVWNIADMGIVMGAVTLMWYVWRKQI